MQQIIIYITMLFILFSCENNKNTMFKVSHSISQTTTSKSPEWVFIESNFKQVKLDSALPIGIELPILTKSTSGMFDSRIDSIIGKLVHEPILMSTSLRTKFDVRYILHQHIAKDSINIILYSKSVWNKYKEIFLATYIKEKMISKIQLSKYTKDNSEICCSVLYPNLLIEKCVDLDYDSSRFIVESKYFINEIGEIKLINQNRLGYTKKSCNCKATPAVQ